MNANSLFVAKIAHLLDWVNHQRGTGELILAGSKQQWQLYFFHGRLLYATGGSHRVRRWQRALKQHCPNFIPKASFVDEPWEYHQIEQGIAENQIGVNQARSIIQTSVLEVFFEIVSYANPVKSRWQNSKPPNTQIALLDANQIFQKILRFWEQWQAQDLGNFSPSLAPILRQPHLVKNLKMENMASLLNGENTLWDISYQNRIPAIAAMVSLLPLVSQGIVEFKQVGDLPLPIGQISRASSNLVSPNITSLHKPLIACIDDSPVMGKTLENLLLPAGYRVLNITNPLQQMTTLVKEKPDLIFLDLLMPDTNGYNLCTFLRKTPIFEKTPIVILTSRDNIINRAHARLIGASDFLSKPAEREKVMQTLQKYLVKKDRDIQVIRHEHTLKFAQ
ncbi:response regulator [Aerosakkonema funiforme]|uniref:Protein PatA n=1 Tax=Aerosakkonema funiforme FACHB-1375 TaxID=2949571 RepID=A0A926ZI77_9CYAN|nr:response regulator [Aerosakkonema funiforme]MBD2182947.1 response regulator [Aerosakkonema funiforme FACHB-1375]